MEDRCPVCNKAVKLMPEAKSERERFFPFCSRRCKLVDLGAWLDGKYRIIADVRSQDLGGSTDVSSNAGSGRT
ncbi:MAG: DNA gyrase inhibitor YacG [Planctomycetota bacterium]|jgi:endogenous inhibitor of DNA gyrase (YacG/DUF329 family)